MRFVLLVLLRAYQLVVSPLLAALGGPGTGCRFSPSCSEYARQAIAACGPARGGWLSARRLCRCHPWSAGGSDPAPGSSPSPLYPAWIEKA